MKKGIILAGVLLLGAFTFAQDASNGSAQGQGRARGQGPNAAKAPTNEGLYITAEQMQDILDKGPVKDGKPGSLSTRLFNASTFSCAFIRVVAIDQPHTHGDWSEVYVIRSGSGDFETGGTMKGPWTSGSAVHQGFFVDQSGKPTAQSAAAQQAPANGAHQGDPPPGVDAAGTSIESGHIQHVKAGDIVLVPAGTGWPDTSHAAQPRPARGRYWPDRRPSRHGPS